MRAVSDSNKAMPRNCAANILSGLVLIVPAACSGPASAQGHQGPIAGRATGYELSVPADSLAPARQGAVPVVIRPRINPLASMPDAGQRGTWTRSRAPLDPLALRSQNPAGRTPTTDLRFNGIGNPLACNGCSPPDTTGDVGERPEAASRGRSLRGRRQDI